MWACHRTLLTRTAPWKSTFLRELSDDAIDTMIACFARCPTPTGQLLLKHVHGAAVRVGVEETAFPHRTEGYNFLVLSQWMDPAMTDPASPGPAKHMRRWSPSPPPAGM